MDLIFEPEKGNPFLLEVGFFDSVLEIKQKIQKYHAIPVPKQTLIFTSKPSPTTVTSDTTTSSTTRASPSSSSPRNPIATRLRINVKISTPKTHVVSLEVDPGDTVLSLKDKIAEAELVPPNRAVVVHWNGSELQDHRSLKDCGVLDGSEVEVSFRPLISTTNSNNKTMMMRVMVLTKCGTRKIPVDVSASDNVVELRNELQKLHHKLNFHLPPEGYFFIHKQAVMDEDMSFRWHRVGPGDTIEIFNGTVTSAGS